MSLYGSMIHIDGVPCGLVMRGSCNGQYQVVFEREMASLEQVEAIRWERPVVEGSCVLPAGYGFTVSDIRYDAATRSYTVILQVGEQYLGDVTGYQSQVEQLERTVTKQWQMLQEKDETIAKLERTAGEMASASAGNPGEAGICDGL